MHTKYLFFGYNQVAFLNKTFDVNKLKNQVLFIN